MAIYHLNAKVIGRNDGRSATAAAAYRAAARIVDERTGLVFDFTKKRGVDGSEIMTPNGTAFDRAALWNAVEKSEKRKDAQVAREVEIALPRELSPDENRALVRSFVAEVFVSQGMIADIAFHNLTGTNPHAHILLTLRQWGRDGFGLKRRDWNEQALCVEWRERWADFANTALQRAGHAARIDARTLAEQAADAAEQGKTEEAAALDRVPTIHERGRPAARAHNTRTRAANAQSQSADIANPVAAAEATPVPCAPPKKTDAEFVAAMLAERSSTAGRWRLYHQEAETEAAWLRAHADDRKEREEGERKARVSLHEVRYLRDQWLRENRKPFWPWRRRRWRAQLAVFQRSVDEAKQTARHAIAANSHDAALQLLAEREAHRKRLTKALAERRKIAPTPSEKTEQEKAATLVAQETANNTSTPQEPEPKLQPTRGPRRR